jgi:hypothetical protein
MLGTFLVRLGVRALASSVAPLRTVVATAFATLRVPPLECLLRVLLRLVGLDCGVSWRGLPLADPVGDGVASPLRSFFAILENKARKYCELLIR